LDLLAQVVKFSNRAYIFDNSGSEFHWIAEITEGKEIDIKTEYYPALMPSKPQTSSTFRKSFA